MTPQEVIRQFMATLVEHDYDNSKDFKSYVLDDAIKSASKFSDTQEVIDAMIADQVEAEKAAVEEVLGSSYAGKTISQVSSSILKADAKDYDTENTGNAYYNKYNDSRSTVEALIKERKAYIFLEKYCGIQLESKYWITSGGSVTRWTGETTGNVDTGAITGADANITLQSGDVVEDRTLTAADLTELAQNYGDKATLSDDGKTIIIGTGTEKTETSVVPEEFINTYTTSTTAAQVINTGTRDWVVKATSKADTITSGGADSISSGAGDDIITVNGNGATITTGTGYDAVDISATVKDVTLSDLNYQDAITISGTFEVGEATIEDMVLVITDATGTRKVKFSDFTTATNATINIDGTSTTIGDWLTDNGIDLDNLEETTYAESVGVGTSSGNIAADGEDRTVVDDDDRTAIDTDYTPPTTKTVENSAAPDVTSNTASADFATATGVVTVNLDELDTSAAGSAVVDGTKVGTLSSTYPDAAAFTRNGLTIHLLGELTKSTVNQNIANGYSPDKPEDSDGGSQINPLTLDDLTDSQKTIIAGLFKWWAKYALTLNEEAYGIGFESDTAKVKDIGLYFYNDSGHDGNLAAVWSWGTSTEPGYATQLMLSVNTYYYDNLSDTDVDGTTTVSGAGLLDRTLSHEFVHASMASNITYFSLLPKFIKEGTAELTHGIDDERGNSIFRIAYDADRLEASLDVDGTDNSGLGNAYAGGYMFLRYFARNAALQTLFDPEPNPLLITLTEGDDTYTNTLEGATILALGGNDTIDNRKSNVSISGGADNDKIWNSGANVTIDGGDGDDSIDTTNDNVIIDGGDGDDYINNSGYYDFSDDLFHTGRVTINGGAGVDTIWNDGSDSTISGGEGDDYITNSGDNVSIDGGEGNDYIYNSGSNVTINGGAGNDSISNDGYDDLESNYVNPDNVIINAGEGNDYIDSFGVNSTILGGEGDDTIIVYRWKHFIDGGSGNDYISATSYSTISGGDGDDSIYNSYANITIDGGSGNDLIYNGGYKYPGVGYTLSGGDNVTMSGGAGNDSIWNYGSNSTLDGGTGNDFIFNSGDNVTFVYNLGDGNDTIDGFNATSTLSIAGGAYTSQESGDDIVITVGEDSVLLIGAAALGTLNIEGEEARVVWTLDGTIATYGTTDETLITITGLKRGLTVNDDGTITGIDLDGDVITLSANVLGTSTVKVSGDCYLALGDDVEESTSESRWKISGTTATLRNSTTAGYTLSDDAQSITYTPAQTGAALVTITGLKSGLTVNGDGTITGIDFNDDNTIYLSANVLGTTTVKVTGDYTLALGVDVPEPEEGNAEWKITSKATAATTTAVLGDKTTAGYSLSDDEKSITYTSDKTTTIATISGLKKGATVDELTDGIEYDTDSETITLYASVLGTTKVTVKDSTKNTNYTLTLGEDVVTEAEETKLWAVSGTTATFKSVESAYFSESTNGKTINYKASAQGKTLATVSGLKSKLPVNGDGTITGIDLDDDNVITLSDNVLNQKKVTLKGTGYALALGVDVELSEQAEAPEWNVSGTKATLNVTTSAGYSCDGSTITYSKNEKTAAVVTLTGLTKNLTAEEVDAAVTVEDDVITLSADVLGTTKVTVKEKGYTLALGDDVDEPQEVEDAWIISGTKATLSDGTSAGYTLSKDARSITYSAAKAGKAKATITGLNKGATEENIDFDGETVTLSADALGTSKVTLKGDGYALALSDDVDAVEYEDYDWTLNAKKQTATLKANTTAGYSCDGSTVTYTAAKKNATIATITGVTDESGLDFDGETVTLSGDSLTDKVTVSGNVAFEFADDFNDGTITGSKAADIITVNGTGVTINAGKGDDQLTTAGGNTFVYASGDGDDVIANFTEDDRIKVTSGTAKVTADDSDVKVTVGKGTITLTDAAGQTISILDSKNKATTYETAAADSDPYWFIDDDFTTTPQLGDITAEVNSMLGEMDITTDPTQLVQTTPVVTASDKK